MKSSLKISIITPSFNQGNFIEDAIISVMEQDYSNYEHIIIDGGSKDETLSILRKYPHLIWISEPDEGQTDALQKALQKVSGDIIGWLNADDYYDKNIFFKVVKELNLKNIDAIYANLKYVDINKLLIRERISKSSYFLSNKFVSKFICFIPSTTFFFKREILNEKIYFDKNINFGMDKDFFANIYHNDFKIKKIETNFAFFRLHENNKFEHKRNINNLINDTKEGILIYNKYSKLKLPKNFFGFITYLVVRFFIKILGFLIFNFSKKKLKYENITSS